MGDLLFTLLFPSLSSFLLPKFLSTQPYPVAPKLVLILESSFLLFVYLVSNCVWLFATL